MGIVDSNKFLVTCRKCGKKGNVSVRERSSSYDASWQSGPELEQFQVQWNEQGSIGPVIEMAKCRACGDLAIVEQLA